MAQIRAKSMAMGEAFLALAAERLAGHGFTPACPAEAQHRGSQVSLTHPQGYAIMQALIAKGVIGDFRAPDILRFGFAPLYNRYEDVWNAIEALHQVMASRAWAEAAFQVRAKVT